jgi:misacylated tRNA(Ala) deacylase
VRGRGLPDDHAGPIRVVTIEGVDSNMCCGTHVNNLSDLQVGGERVWGAGDHDRTRVIEEDN